MKQTESLLKNGYVTSRGKAYASGTAYPIGSGTFYRYDFSGNGGYQKFDVNDNLVDTWGDVSNAVGDATDAAEQFADTLDWIEIRMEEIEEALGLLSAELENAADISSKNNIIDEMIAVNQQKYANALSGANYYENYIDKYWNQIPAKYQEWAKNGAIEVTDFAGDANEAVVEAIEKYREYAQKAADLTQQAEETITEIRDLAIQRIDNIQDYGSAKTSIEDAQTEKLQNRVDLDEASGLVTSSAYYTAMMENSGKKIEYWTKKDASGLSLIEKMQAEFDEAVKSGKIEVGTVEWYEQLEKLYEVQAEVDEATIELEEFQNAINDIYWDNFENLTDQIEYLKDQTQSLIDLMENSGDLVAEPEKRKHEGGTVEYWTADDVKWTDEGLASLGLYAQQMEIAEFEARQYAEAIDDLTADYEAGLYSESEYLEKLDELTSAQYDSIEAYYEAQDAIVELNETRVDMIKDGIEKEIEAREELIRLKKEELDADKDAHDFQKNVMDQQQTISEIQRKLDALEFDTSTSAMAQKARLEEELVKASAELNETYLDRSVSDQHDALDKELEEFQATKDAEIAKWDEYLTNVELIVADSLNTVQANALTIYDTLNSKAQEYNLTLSDSIMSPWRDGALAVSDYQNTFDTAMSSTMNQLAALKDAWREVIREMATAAEIDVSEINAENANYAAATQQTNIRDTVSVSKPVTQTPTVNNQPSNNTNTSSSGNITVGGKINAGSATIYQSSSGTGGSRQYFSSDPVYVVLEEQNGYIKVRHHSASSGVTGWFKKSDVKAAYAKGTKGVKEDQLAWIDENGLEELVLHAGPDGRLQYLTKGTSVLNSTLTDRLMNLAMDPQNMLDQNRPSIGVHPEIHNTEINLNITYGDMVSIGEYNGNNLEGLEKMVAKQFEKHTKDLNSAIRRFAR